MVMIHVSQRAQKQRHVLRLAGLRPVQIWVPDTRRPNFTEECRQQCLLVSQSDHADTSTEQLMDEALADLEDWED